MSDLRDAVINGNIDQVKNLIAQEVDVDDTDGSDYGSPLHVAAKKGNCEIITLLLDAGANINLKNEDMGATPLMIAVDAGQPEAVILLLKRGADPQSVNFDGANALLYAQGAPEKVRTQLISILNKN